MTWLRGVSVAWFRVHPEGLPSPHQVPRIIDRLFAGGSGVLRQFGETT